MAVHPLPDIEEEQERQLVDEAQRGDNAAFAELLEPWRRPLFGYVYRMVTHPQDAEDLTQEAVTRAFQSMSEFRGNSRFKTWLFGIATHVCLDHLLDVTESVFRHRLSSARSQMCSTYEGLCQLINKTGVCYQCKELREHAPEENQGDDLAAITLAPGLDLTPDNLLDARIRIAREADLEDGRTKALHQGFFIGLTDHEEKV